MKRITYVFIFQFLLFWSYAQKCVDPEVISVDKISFVLNELASERFQGRYPGSQGDSIAVAFIVDQLKEIGLIPMGEAGNYTQPFTVKLQVKISDNTLIKSRKAVVKPSEQVYPTRFSDNRKVKGRLIAPVFTLKNSALTVEEPRKVRKKIAVVDLYGLKELYQSQGLDFKTFKIQDLIQLLKDYKVKGLLLTSTKVSGVPVPERFFETQEPVGLPVWYVSKDLIEGLQKLKRIKVITQIYENQVTTYNIAGYWENGAPYTFIIGAHYDHLGMGDKNSTYRGEPQIHPGADDNASGVAGAMALANYIAEFGNRNFNYLFLFFGAEEQGLLGSKHWVSNPTYPMEKITAMLNFDMIGRLGDDRNLKISGTGTMPEWENAFRQLPCYNITYQLSRGGRGPSDHTSFYNQNIPVLHFFTGLHPDYHKPSDIPARINIFGIRDVVALSASLIEYLDQLPQPLTFTPTDDQQESRPVRLSVTMGIMPGYNSDNKGLEVEGVTKGKPADKAGIIKGDYIVKIGNMPIRNIRDYMEALSQYEKGDTAPVQILRAEKILEVNVLFE
ncbi:M28 family peptidase [Thermaurantimonas aggregans]|uniref:M28 family peptidase n=1 Tax=Thermaurantimonas aggregans TaxID=2173829 RepID=UPI0023F28A7C|nr:M28 family peptidase [Thermaurantimonas aggregans]MCX8148457.1 M28 family peptidase [Thermaurantimonas aggregans]